MTECSSLPNAACAEPGRQMFFDFIGQYFAATPRLVQLPLGTSCSICGSGKVQLWRTESNEAVCIAQNTITRKRAARTLAAEPCIPPLDPSGKTSMGDGNMIIAGPHRALIVTKLLPDKPLPSGLEVTFSEPGSMTAAKLDLIKNPPKPPFVVMAFEKNAKFRTRITIDESQIIINGPSGHLIDRASFQFIDRPNIARLIAIAQKMEVKNFKELMALRDRLANGGALAKAQFESDQNALLKLRSECSISMREFRSLPSPRSFEGKLLTQLL